MNPERVRLQIGLRPEKPVDEITMGTFHLHAVKTHSQTPARAVRELRQPRYLNPKTNGNTNATTAAQIP